MEDEQYTALKTAMGEALVSFKELRLTVAEDVPYSDGPLIIERFSDRVDDIVGWLEEMSESLSDCLFHLSKGQDRDNVRKALVFCQSQGNKIASTFCRDLMSYETIRELRRVGRRNGPEWIAWGLSLERALEACKLPIDSLQRALIGAWNEVAKQATSGIVVTNTSIGIDARPTSGDRLPGA